MIVGAKESEVVCMNSLTTNLHLLFVSFYRPTKQRYKIISEAKMFPSDRYLLETQVQHHGFEPDDALHSNKSTQMDHFILRHDTCLRRFTKDDLKTIGKVSGLSLSKGLKKDLMIEKLKV